MKPRLLAAMLAYAVLALLAGLTLQGLFRTAVWIFLAGLALKTAIAARMHSLEETPAPGADHASDEPGAPADPQRP